MVGPGYFGFSGYPWPGPPFAWPIRGRLTAATFDPRAAQERVAAGRSLLLSAEPPRPRPFAESSASLRGVACLRACLVPIETAAEGKLGAFPAGAPMFKKILIANRGEIACRVIKTARRMGIGTVAVFSEADGRAARRDGRRGGGDRAARPRRSPISSIDKIVDACKQTGAEAVHPGYGFLSERAAFAEALADGGHRLHRPQPKRHRGHGRQDRIEEIRQRRQGLDRAGLSRRDRERRAGGARSPTRSAIR